MSSGSSTKRWTAKEVLPTDNGGFTKRDMKTKNAHFNRSVHFFQFEKPKNIIYYDAVKKKMIFFIFFQAPFLRQFFSNFS